MSEHLSFFSGFIRTKWLLQKKIFGKYTGKAGE